MVDFLNLNFGRVDTEIDYVNLMPGMSAPKAPYLDRVQAFTRELTLPTFHACRIVDAATARRVIEEGIVDMVGMTRAHIADPHIVRKIEAGEEGRIRPCVGATYCMDHRFCIHNPSTGREKTLPHESPGAQASKRVVVVGGGPAGLEAARVCASRGHEVILLESADRLGGQVALAAKAGWRREIAGVTDWLAGEIGHLGVDVRLSTHADREIVTGLGPEVVIVATGGLPDLEWLDGHEHCDSVSDILGGAAVAKNVLVYDELGDHAGASAAEFLADRGAEVELVFRGHHAAERSGYCNYPVYLQHFYEKGVTLMPDQRLERVERSGTKLRAVFANELTGEMVERLSDQVVVERGTVPADALFEELRPGSCNNGAVDPARLLAGLPQTAGSRGDRGFELYKVGDAVSSRDIHCAILDSRRLCRAL